MSQFTPEQLFRCEEHTNSGCVLSGVGRGRTGALSPSLLRDCPQCGATMGGRGTERDYFCMPTLAQQPFFLPPERGEHRAPSCGDGGSWLCISTEGHRPGLGSHTHSPHLTAHMNRCPQHGTQGREVGQKESRCLWCDTQDLG